jgi:hypothetical protein
MKTCARKDSQEDQELQKRIIAKTNYSLSVLGRAIARHGSGEFVWLGPAPSKRR